MISLFACYFLYKLHLYSAWNDIIDVVGRTDAEMNDLVTKITTNLGDTEIKTCPSKQCIIVDVNVDVNDDEMFLLGAASIDNNKHSSGSSSSETIEVFLHRSLRRILNDSGTDHTIINGITRLAMPDDAIDGDEFRNKRRAEYEEFYDDEDEDAGPSPAQNVTHRNTQHNTTQRNEEKVFPRLVTIPFPPDRTVYTTTFAINGFD